MTVSGRLWHGVDVGEGGGAGSRGEDGQDVHVVAPGERYSSAVGELQARRIAEGDENVGFLQLVHRQQRVVMARHEVNVAEGVMEQATVAA